MQIDSFEIKLKLAFDVFMIQTFHYSSSLPVQNCNIIFLLLLFYFTINLYL